MDNSKKRLQATATTTVQIAAKNQKWNAVHIDKPTTAPIAPVPKPPPVNMEQDAADADKKIHDVIPNEIPPWIPHKKPIKTKLPWY